MISENDWTDDMMNNLEETDIDLEQIIEILNRMKED